MHLSRRADAYRATRDSHRRRARLLSRGRLVTMAAAVACFIWAFAHAADPTRLTAAFVLLAAFFLLVVLHARADREAAWYDALVVVNERAVARRERRWDDLPPAPAPRSADLAGHPYALDLDLFGRASLFQWLGPPATSDGQTQLASWLLSAADPDRVRMRQGAVAELAPLDDWREQLAAHGLRAAGARPRAIDAFVAWTEEHGELAGPGFQLLVYVTTAAIWISLALSFAHVVSAPYWMGPVALGLILTSSRARTAHRALDRAGAGEDALLPYADLFAHAVNHPFEDAALQDLRERLTANGIATPALMRRLGRILGFAALRQTSPLLYVPVQLVTLWDFHFLFALGRWRRDAGPRMRGWVAAIGELEAYAALAGVQRDNPDWCVPEVGRETQFVAKALGHPLLANDRRVTNDVEIGPRGTILLVTARTCRARARCCAPSG
jgi:hypothetical protein